MAEMSRMVVLPLTLALTVAAAGLSGCGNMAEEPGDAAATEISQKEPGDAAASEISQNVPESRGGEAAPGGMESEAGAAAVTDFGLRLLRQCMSDSGASLQASGQSQNGRIVSPLSVLSALAMTGNGADGETLKQMEDTFGITVPELSAYLSGWHGREASGKTECKFHMANGIWFTQDESFTVEQDFLDTCADSFGAGMRRVPFDNAALKEINGWVEQNTDGMIREILDRISEDAVMYLVNALAFEGEWETVYREDQVRESDFTQADGSVRKVDMMYSTESDYLEDEHATGFLKYYAGRQYAYAALLPEEGMDVADYLASLDGEKLQRILSNPLETTVWAGIPRYESEYGAELGDILQDMGMTDAFDTGKADFSKIGHSTKGNIYISRVLHKAFIAVDEQGTRAGAATAVMMEAGGAIMDLKEVYLDRPFVYMIVDCETGVPVFMGVLTGVE